MHLAHLEDLLLYVSSSDDETDYCFHSLEILSLMLREQVNAGFLFCALAFHSYCRNLVCFLAFKCPKRLAKATPDRTITEKEEDVK